MYVSSIIVDDEPFVGSDGEIELCIINNRLNIVSPLLQTDNHITNFRIIERDPVPWYHYPLITPCCLLEQSSLLGASLMALLVVGSGPGSGNLGI